MTKRGEGRPGRIRSAEHIMRKTGRAPGPPVNLPYRPLAVSCGCPGCRELVTEGSLRREEKSTHAGLCARCNRAMVTRYYREHQDRTSIKADRHGMQWTGPELQLASRRDLSAQRVADMTGRTLAAVMNARSRIHNEPRSARLADTDSSNARKARP